jgi:hypothetical protein
MCRRKLHVPIWNKHIETIDSIFNKKFNELINKKNINLHNVGELQIAYYFIKKEGDVNDMRHYRSHDWHSELALEKSIELADAQARKLKWEKWEKREKIRYTIEKDLKNILDYKKCLEESPDNVFYRYIIPNIYKIRIINILKCSKYSKKFQTKKTGYRVKE